MTPFGAVTHSFILINYCFWNYNAITSFPSYYPYLPSSPPIHALVLVPIHGLLEKLSSLWFKGWFEHSITIFRDLREIGHPECTNEKLSRWGNPWIKGLLEGLLGSRKKHLKEKSHFCRHFQDLLTTLPPVMETMSHFGRFSVLYFLCYNHALGLILEPLCSPQIMMRKELPLLCWQWLLTLGEYLLVDEELLSGNLIFVVIL